MHSIRSIRALALALTMLAMSAASQAQVAVSINIAPPALQKSCPFKDILL
jgi:hypothetical protein